LFTGMLGFDERTCSRSTRPNSAAAASEVLTDSRRPRLLQQVRSQSTRHSPSA
jgi:hypothetical protein